MAANASAHCGRVFDHDATPGPLPARHLTSMYLAATSYNALKRRRCLPHVLCAPEFDVDSRVSTKLLMCSRSEASDVSMTWQKRIMKGMNGDWVMVLHFRIRSIYLGTEGGNDR